MGKVADKLPEVTDEQWLQVNNFNRKITEEFLQESTQLSPKTLKQYKSALRQFFWWIKENEDNKSILEIESLDYLKFQNSLIRREISPSGVRFKRSAISSLNGYILLYYEKKYPTFKNFISKKIANPPKSFVHEKEPLTLEEYKMLIEKLESNPKKNYLQPLAYLKFSFATACRREEARLLLKEVVDYKLIEKEIEVSNKQGTKEKKTGKYYLTNDIRCKGKGKVGKVRKMKFNEEAMGAIKKWLEFRGEDNCPYVFVSKRNGQIKQVGENTFNGWCKHIFEPIVGRRVHPHLFRESRATTMVVEEEMDIRVAQKLLGHESSETTEIYVIRNGEDESDEAFI